MTVATATCSVCDDPAIARGWCKTHYVRWWRHGDPQAGEVIKRRRRSCRVCGGAHKARGLCAKHYKQHYPPERRESAWTVRDRVLDYLEADGGWLTAEGLALAVDCNPTTTFRALGDLRDDGHVECRSIALAYSDRTSNYERRQEWRAL